MIFERPPIQKGVRVNTCMMVDNTLAGGKRRLNSKGNFDPK